jgi:hypothetical protein
MNQQRKDHFHLYSQSPHLPQFQLSARATPLSSLSGARPKTCTGAQEKCANAPTIVRNKQGCVQCTLCISVAVVAVGCLYSMIVSEQMDTMVKTYTVGLTINQNKSTIATEIT